MERRIRARIGMVAAVLLALFSVIGVPAASAYPTNVDVFCESGSASFYCQVTYTGTVDPTTITWYRNGQHIPAFDNRAFVQQSCVIGSYYTLLAVVTDSQGSAQNSWGFECRRHWQ